MDLGLGGYGSDEEEEQQQSEERNVPAALPADELDSDDSGESDSERCGPWAGARFVAFLGSAEPCV